MEITIAANTLRALLTHAAKNDVRYYLEGICIDMTGANTVLVATDGHRLLAINRPEDAPDGHEYIIPRSLLEPVLKGSKDFDVTITADAASRDLSIRTPDITGVGKLLDRKFPDWRRVVPAKADGGRAAYNVDYLKDATRAMILLGFTAKPFPVARIVPNGETEAGMWVEDDVVLLIMPARDKKRPIPETNKRPPWVKP